MGIKLYLASEYEYRRGLANRLLDENVIDFCLTDHLPWTESPRHDNRIIEIDHRPSHRTDYDEIIDLNDLPAIGKDLMEKMLPYESMAVKMQMRTTFDVPIAEYSEGKRRYLQHLRYWNYMLDKYSINLIITSTIPHSMGMFVVYGLSRVRQIPMLIWFKIGLLQNRCLWGDSLETLGESVGKKYLYLADNNVNIADDSFDIDVAKALKSFSDSTQWRRNSERGKSIQIKYKNNLVRNEKKLLYEKIFKTVLRSVLKEYRIPSLSDKRFIWIRQRKQFFSAYDFYRKHLRCTPREHKKIIQPVDYSKRYVIFFLQTYPEASTMPLAGVFEEQYNSIELLARVAEKYGIMVYVREHPADECRTKNFYSELSAIKNVVFIDSNTPSIEVMRNSVCIATQTGTCILESLLIRKPVVVFGSGYYYKECPNLFEITSEDQGEMVFEKIINGVDIEDVAIKRYLYALQSESIKEFDDETIEKRVFNSNYVVEKFPIDDRIILIKRFISRVQNDSLSNDN